jgi:formylglycine-generating enzyme required for sulfatase activity
VRKMLIGCVLLCAVSNAWAAAPAGMVEIPAGAFTMGRDDGPADERPAHTVHLTAFFIDRLPVTNAQYAQYLNATNGRLAIKDQRLYDHDDPDARVHYAAARQTWLADSGYENHPVVEATWLGAREYCSWQGKRLPTEAEWEKAARGTDARRYPWGNGTPTRSHAQFGARFNDTAPVENFNAGASAYGMLGMAGNAWHWVASAYRPYPYDDGDGREDSATGPVRATRGGGHDSPADEITTTQRGRTLSRNPRSGHHNIGFRCAK